VLTLNSYKTEFLLIGLKQQLAKISFCSLDTAHSARNLGFSFDEHISFSDQMSALSKSCYSHIRQLRCIRPYIDYKTARTITISIVHSKLDYCNSLYYNVPNTQLNRLQLIQNSVARAVVRAPKSSHMNPALKCLHWLKVKQHIDYKILCLTFKVLTTTDPLYLYNLISVQPHYSTHSSDIITLSCVPFSYSLKVNNCSFRHASPCLWNQLPRELCLPTDREDVSLSSDLTHVSSSSPASPLSPSITPSHLYSRLKTHLSHKSFPP